MITLERANDLKVKIKRLEDAELQRQGAIQQIEKQLKDEFGFDESKALAEIATLSKDLQRLEERLEPKSKEFIDKWSEFIGRKNEQPR